jgi:hypothetical protein
VHAWAKGAERAELGAGEGEIERDAEVMDREGGGKVFMVVEKSSEARLRAPSLIKRPLNLGSQLRLLNMLIVLIFLNRRFSRLPAVGESKCIAKIAELPKTSQRVAIK